jgi:hypothetical protein
MGTGAVLVVRALEYIAYPTLYSTTTIVMTAINTSIA